MELRHLRYFVAVAEELNFRRAAERLHVSPPALSVQIRALEGLLNVRLCERDTTRVRLTMAGEVLLAKARALLQHAQEAAEAAQEAARGHQGTLRVGNPGMFGTSFLPEALAIYQRRFPKVDLSLVDIEIEHEQPRAVEDRAIQIGFVYGPRLQGLKEIEHVLVIDVPMCVVMGKGNPLASLREAPLARLAEQPLLALAYSPNHGKDMLALFRAQKLAPKAVKKVKGYAAYLAMLAGGRGVSFLPRMRHLVRTEGLVTRPLKGAGPDFRLQLHAVWKTAETSPQVKNFIKVLRQLGVRHD